MICISFQVIDYDENNINAFDEHLFSEMRDNFSTEDIHIDFQQCFLFQHEENSINVDCDINNNDLPEYDTKDVDIYMDTSSYIDLDEHLDSLAFDMEEVFFTDNKGSIDLDDLYDPLEQILIEEVNCFQSAGFELDIRVEKLNVQQDLDPAYSYDYSEKHLHMSQPPENQSANISEKRTN